MKTEDRIRMTDVMNIPETIYKIRDWNKFNHRRILTNNELFLASPSSLNDNMDCRNTFDFSLLDTEEKKALYLEQLALENPLNKDQNEFDYNKLFQDLSIKLSTPMGRQKHQEEYNELFFKMLDSQYGVLSLTTEWNIEALWNRYGAEQTGFAVGFNELKLKFWVFEGNTLFIKGGMVSYYEELPRIDPLDSEIPEIIFNMTHSKSSRWKEETEYRFTTHFGALFGEDFIPSLHQRKIQIPEEIMSEVILGKECSMKHQTEIISIAKKKSLPVFRIYDTESGELKRDKIA